MVYTDYDFSNKMANRSVRWNGIRVTEYVRLSAERHCSSDRRNCP
jgi:hypothetical protein